jgi:hypothetical protein
MPFACRSPAHFMRRPTDPLTFLPRAVRAFHRRLVGNFMRGQLRDFFFRKTDMLSSFPDPRETQTQVAQANTAMLAEEPENEPENTHRKGPQVQGTTSVCARVCAPWLLLRDQIVDWAPDGQPTEKSQKRSGRSWQAGTHRAAAFPLCLVCLGVCLCRPLLPYLSCWRVES